MGNRRSAADERESLAGWEALVEADAATRRSVCSTSACAPRPPIRWRCSGARASPTNAARPSRRSPATRRCWPRCTPAPTAGGPLLAPVAAGRLLTLYDEVGAATRKRIVDGLRPAELARAADLPWQARVELARLAAHAAREAADAAELARVARAGRLRGAGLRSRRGGTAAQHRSRRAPPPAGRPPRRPGGRCSRRAAGWMSPRPPTGVAARACCASRSRCPRATMTSCSTIPPRRASRSTAARRWRTARRRATGRTCRRCACGSQPGRHDLELRLATRGGVARLSLAVLGSGRRATPASATSTRARAARVGRRRPSSSPSIRRSRRAARGRGAGAARLLHGATPRSGATRRTRRWCRRNGFAARPRFALGHALAAAIAREDTTRPMSFAQDGGAQRAARRGVDRPEPGAAVARAGGDRARGRSRRATASTRPAPRRAPPRAGGRRRCCSRARSPRAGWTSTPSGRWRAARRHAAYDQMPRARCSRRCAARRASAASWRARRAWRRRWSRAAATSRRASIACGRAASWRRRARRCARRWCSSRGAQDLVTDLASVLAAEGATPRPRRARGAGRARSE